MNYMDYNDYELLNYIAEKNEEATEIMYKKYEPLINSIANKMLKYVKGTGLDINDLIQEGMLGLSKAIDNYNYNIDATFYTFAKKCIERKIISQIVSNTRLKKRILNEAISIEATDENGKSTELEFLLKDNSENPELVLMNEQNELALMEKAKNVLTDFEQQVFELKIVGFNYKEIATLLEKDTKAIDNATQRIKTKLKKELQKDD